VAKIPPIVDVDSHVVEPRSVWSDRLPGRLIPLCIVPLWDVDLAVAEVRRNAAGGVRAVAFTERPAYLDLPSLHSRYWGDASRLGRGPGQLPRAAVHVLLPPDPQLLLQGRRRGRAAGQGRRRQRDVRDRLPAPGRHLARSREEAALQFGYLEQDLVDKIARGNAIKLLGRNLPKG
jgi:hypothetical protein